MGSLRRDRARRAAPAWVAALVVLSGLGLSAQAAAAPLDPVSPDDDAVVGLRPTFGWETAPVTALSRTEVYVELPGGPVEVAEVPSGTSSATSQVALPDDSRLRWFVRSSSSGGAIVQETPVARRRHIRVATSPDAPAITGAPAPISRSPTPLFAWSGSRVSSRWSILGPAGAPVQTGEVPSAGGQVVPAGLTDGSYQFRVAQRNLVGVEGPPASVGFSIDNTAPGALRLRRSTPRPDSRNTPAYAWAGLEPGAVATWRILRAGGELIQGPSTVAAGSATPGRLGPGSYVFEARQTDLAGNASLAASDGFVVLPRLAAGIRLPMLNVRRLRPEVGATIMAVRPTLRWGAGPKGTRIYNLQVFRVVDGAKLRKVVSVFPQDQRYLVPRAKALSRGACYVWRVWPFQGARPAGRPVGVSHFCVRPV